MDMKFGLMVLYFKVNIEMVKSMGEVFLSSQTVRSTKVSSKTTVYLVMGSMNGQMVKYSKDNGSRIGWKARESQNGMMEGSMREIIVMIRRMDLESFSGVMEGNI